MRERTLLAMAAAIIEMMQKMDGAIAPRDRRTTFRFVRTLARIGPQSRSAARQTRAAWQKIPAYLQRQIIELPAAAGGAEELRRIVGDDAWPHNIPPRLPDQPDESLDLEWFGSFSKRGKFSRSSGQWKDEDYDVLADGKVVGRILEEGSRFGPPELRWGLVDHRAGDAGRDKWHRGDAGGWPRASFAEIGWRRRLACGYEVGVNALRQAPLQRARFRSSSKPDVWRALANRRDVPIPAIPSSIGSNPE
jgi:hypothetical protein